MSQIPSRGIAFLSHAALRARHCASIGRFSFLRPHSQICFQPLEDRRDKAGSSRPAQRPSPYGRYQPHGIDRQGSFLCVLLMA